MARGDVVDLVEHWNVAPPLVECARIYLGIRPVRDEPVDTTPRPATEEQWKAMCEREKTYAAQHGGPRNPFTA